MHRYQCAYNTFEQSGYTRSDAQRVMRKAVQLARVAKERFLAERPDTRGEDVKIALSLGPYGSTVNANEFDGMYPPPFGPEDATRNTFHAGEDHLCDASLEALKNFHLERLRVFAEDKETWESIDWVAFETTPLRREVTAIRMAMTALEREASRKPWWVSTVHPHGKHPEPISAEHTGTLSNEDGDAASVRQIVQVSLGEDPRYGPLSVPNGIGVNCTGVGFLERILSNMSTATKELQDHSAAPGRHERPLLVVYPNGIEWDLEKRTWTSHNVGDGSARARVQSLIQTIRPYAEATDGVWGGVIVGGCCKFGPEEISALTSEVSCFRT